MDEKKEIKFGPADYRAVEDKAKAMSKPELEEYYVNDRNKRHPTCVGTIGTIFTILIVIFAIGAIGFSIGLVMEITQVQDTIIRTANEICPFVGEGYVSENFFKGSSFVNRIVCTKYNSKGDWFKLLE